MDSFTIRNVKAEKANAILRYRRLQKVATLFRFIEICVFFIMISRFSTRLPITLKVFVEYFRDIFVSLLSPRFVFVVGNAIIIILFVKSGQFSAQHPTGVNTESSLHDKFMENSEKVWKIREDGIKNPRNQSTGKENAVAIELHASEEAKIYGSHRSENLVLEHCKKSHHVLRRSETEKCRKSSDLGEKKLERSYSEDNMSNEEFRRTVEAFIARQQRFLREEESLALVA